MGLTQLEDGTYVPSYYTNIDFSSNYYQAAMNTDYDTKIANKNKYLQNHLFPIFYINAESTKTNYPSTSDYDGRYNGTSGTYPSAALDTTTNKSYTDSTAGYNAMIASRNAAIKQRNALDAKISFISSPRNVSNGSDSSMLFNSTFYMTILWTVLATFLIYYIFMEL